MNEQKNLIFAVVLSVAILVGFQFFYEVPRVEQEQARQAELQASGASESSTPSASNVPSGAPVGGSVLPGSTKMSAEDAAKAPRFRAKHE